METRASLLDYTRTDKSIVNPNKILFMKKIFCAAIMLAAAYTLKAQEPAAYTTTTTTVNYTSQVPMVIRTNFQTSNPTVTQVTWMPMSTDYWYASYMTTNNRITRVYYNTQPWYMYEPSRNEGFKVALPVLNTYVPEDVITSAIKTYGNDLFSITARKPAEDGTQSYFVTLIKNGVSEIVDMNGENTVMSKPQPEHNQ